MNEDAVSGPALCAVDITVAETTHKKSQTPSDPNSLTLVGNKSAEGILLLNKLPICDDGWNIEAAHVACRQLGFGRALQATQTNQASSDEFSLDDVKCRGNESLLTDCSHLVGRKENCNSGEAAGVVCDARSKDELRREADQRTEECFAKNVLFGPELNAEVWVRPTVLDCQEMCSGTEGCGTFSYDTSSMECRLQGRNHENWKKNPLGCVSISKPIIFQDPKPVEKAGRRMVSTATSGAQEKRNGTMPKTFARWREATSPLLDPKVLDDIWKRGRAE